MRPKPFDLGPLRASVARGPKGPRWYWRARTTSDRRTVWTGWATREEAQIAVAAVVNAGIPAARTRADDPAGIESVGDLVRAWRAHQERREEAGQIATLTLRNYRNFASYWIDALGDIKLSRLRRTDVELTILDWGADPEAPVATRTIVQSLKTLRQIMNWANKRGLPTVELDRLAPKIDEDDHVYEDYTPTPGEVAKVIAHIGNGEIRDAVALMAITGARVSEIAALRQDSYDPGEGVLFIDGRDESRGRKGKTGRRAFPLPREGRDLVAPRAGSGDGYLFRLPASASRRIHAEIGGASKAAGVHYMTPHGLRRMVVMRLIDHTDLKTVSKLTGHSVATLLRDYVRPDQERLKDAVARAGLGRLGPAGKVLPFDSSGTGSGHNAR